MLTWPILSTLKHHCFFWWRGSIQTSFLLNPQWNMLEQLKLWTGKTTSLNSTSILATDLVSVTRLPSSCSSDHSTYNSSRKLQWCFMKSTSDNGLSFVNLGNRLNPRRRSCHHRICISGHTYGYTSGKQGPIMWLWQRQSNQYSDIKYDLLVIATTTSCQHYSNIQYSLKEARDWRNYIWGEFNMKTQIFLSYGKYLHLAT